MSFSPFFPGSSHIDLLNRDAVEANRMGRLTPVQEQWLGGAPFGGRALMVIAQPLIILPFFCFAGAVMTVTIGSEFWFIIPVLLVVFIVLAWRLLPDLVTGVQRAIKLRADRQSGQIRQAIGELGFGKSGYLAQAGERQLFLPSYGDAGGLLPGARYNFYYFDESGLVLSAEALGGISEAAVRAGLNRILAEANRYTLDDMAANQRGEIASGQRWRLVLKILGGLGLGLLFVGMAAGVTVASFSTGDSLPWPAVIVFVVILGIIVSIGGAMALRGFLDLNTPPDYVEGRGATHTERRSSGRSSRTVYFYDIGEMKFEVPFRAYQALMEGLTYRAYFSPHSKMLLSLEVTDVPELN